MGCDQGTPHDTKAVGEPLRLVYANIGAGQRLPSDGTIVLRFDRYLMPTTVIRQSVVVREADGTVAATPIITYEPVSRTVTIAGPGALGSSWLVPDRYYVLTFESPSASGGFGLRAIDGASFDSSQSPSDRAIGFFASAPQGGQSLPASLSFCRDVYPLLRSRCGFGSCHGSFSTGSLPAMGLALETGQDLADTAIGRPARLASFGLVAGRVASGGTRFGADMALLDPGSPGTSFLLYKLLLSAPGTLTSTPARSACASGEPVAPTRVYPPDAPPFDPASDSERDALARYVAGKSMPYPTYPAGTPDGGSDYNPPLSLEELSRLSAWIAEGARVENCNTCAP